MADSEIAKIAGVAQGVIDLIKAEEGCQRKPYRCTSGKLTIGWGRNLEDRGISQAEADSLLANDLREISGQLAASLPWANTLDGVRYAVLVSMAYQIGISGLLEFKNTLHAVFREAWDAAAKGMLGSKWAKQTPRRARRHAVMMRTGQWV